MVDTGVVDTGVAAITGDIDMVMVRVSETYDLSTKVNRMGLVGIHTPTGSLISKLWGGLALQHKKFRFVKCDVAMACASMLPADPLQIGVEAGSIAPQDMFNPILYRAVSNESMNSLQGFLQSGLNRSSMSKNSVESVNDVIFGDQGNPSGQFDQFDMYYALLADSDNWRKAMPQSGLEMRGLYPLVYSVVSNYGTNHVDATTKQFPTTLGVEPAYNRENEVSNSIAPIQFRGPSMRMPAIDTAFVGSNADGTSISVTNFIGNGNSVSSVDPNATQYVGDNTMGVPPCYVGMIVLPPAKLNQLYYRLKVTWTIEFTGLRSLVDVGNWGYLAGTGALSYGTDYAEQSTSMSSITNMVDTSGADIQKIMEGS